MPSFVVVCQKCYSHSTADLLMPPLQSGDSRRCTEKSEVFVCRICHRLLFLVVAVVVFSFLLLCVMFDFLLVQVLRCRINLVMRARCLAGLTLDSR